MVVAQPPIYVADREGVDIAVFPTVKDAERYIEPIDAVNQEYVVYDVRGRILAVSVDGSHTILAASSEEMFLEELVARINDYLLGLGEVDKVRQPTDLVQFVREAASVIWDSQRKSHKGGNSNHGHRNDWPLGP